MCAHTQRQIDIKIWNYSKKPGLSDVERTIRSAVDDFPNLNSEIDRLYVFIFNNQQIKEGIDLEKTRLDTGLPLGRQYPGWSMMCNYRHKNVGVVEVRIEEFMESSVIRRKFVARHELGHIFLYGPLYDPEILDDLSIKPNLKPIMERILRGGSGWQEYRVDSLMMTLFPGLTIQYMHENVAGFSKRRDGEQLERAQTLSERLFTAIRLEITCEVQLGILKRAPSSLKKWAWRSLKELHTERREQLKRDASEIRPELRDVSVWFTEEYLENPVLLVKRVLELSSFF